MVGKKIASICIIIIGIIVTIPFNHIYGIDGFEVDDPGKITVEANLSPEGSPVSMNIFFI